MGETLKDILNPFKLFLNLNSGYEQHIIYQTKELKPNNTSTVDIKNHCEKFVVLFRQLYKDKLLNGIKVKRSSYYLSVITKDEIYDEEDNLGVYSALFDSKNEPMFVNYYEEDISYIEKDYKIQIEIFLRVFDKYGNEIFDDDETFEEEQPIIPAIKEELCCICYVNEPNILYSDCRHFSTCHDCEEMANFKKCLLCRTDVTKPKIKI